MQVVFTIFGTPTWANGGQPDARAVPRRPTSRASRIAAAKRYSGSFMSETASCCRACVVDGVERAEPVARARAAVAAASAGAG